MMRRFAMLAIGLGLLLGCSADELTEVVVIIETGPALRSQSESLSVVVSRDPAPPPGTLPIFQNSNTRWNDGQYTLALSPDNPRAPGRYVVEATAFVGGQPLARARLISGYVVGQTRYVRMLLEDQCVGVLDCDARSTCRAGACVGAELDPMQFGPNIAEAPSSTTLPASTGVSVDAGIPGGPDARDASDAPNTLDATPADASARDGASFRPSDAMANVEPDAKVPPNPVVPATDAGDSAPRDATVPPALPPGPCQAGYYEGTWEGRYTYGALGLSTSAAVAPAATASAPAVWLVLEPDPSASAPALRVAASCANGRLMNNAVDHPFMARFRGSLDCASGALSGTLLGTYNLNENTDLDFPFTGTIGARLTPTSELVDGSWMGEETSEHTGGLSTGSGSGVFSARFVADTRPSSTEDLCSAFFALAGLE